MDKTSLVATGAAAVVTIAVVAAVVVLTWHGSITGEACVSILSAILGGGIVGGAHALGVGSGARAARGRTR